MKKLFLLFFMLIITFVLFSQDKSQNQMIYLTKEELIKYDGKNNNKAYVASGGIIYDVTGVDSWLNGEHNGYKAGQDITEFIKKAPHGSSVLKKRKAAGWIIDYKLTLIELEKFNGKNNNPAFIAVSGVIYDVTANKAWKNGEHNGFKAGKDVTEGIKKSPHGLKVLNKLKVTGIIIK